MPKYRLLALDVDGTLLDDQKRVPEVNRRALQGLARRGVHVAIASGRMTPRIEPLLSMTKIISDAYRSPHFSLPTGILLRS